MVTSLMARTSTTYPLVDRILEGQLEAKLAEWKTDGKSLQDVAFLLQTEYDVKVSIATVSRWYTAARAS